MCSKGSYVLQCVKSITGSGQDYWPAASMEESRCGELCVHIHNSLNNDHAKMDYIWSRPIHKNIWWFYHKRTQFLELTFLGFQKVHPKMVKIDKPHAQVLHWPLMKIKTEAARWWKQGTWGLEVEASLMGHRAGKDHMCAKIRDCCCHCSLVNFRGRGK